MLYFETNGHSIRRLCEGSLMSLYSFFYPTWSALNWCKHLFTISQSSILINRALWVKICLKIISWSSKTCFCSSFSFHSPRAFSLPLYQVSPLLQGHMSVSLQSSGISDQHVPHIYFFWNILGLPACLLFPVSSSTSVLCEEASKHEHKAPAPSQHPSHSPKDHVRAKKNTCFRPTGHACWDRDMLFLHPDTCPSLSRNDPELHWTWNPPSHKHPGWKFNKRACSVGWVLWDCWWF